MRAVAPLLVVIAPVWLEGCKACSEQDIVPGGGGDIDDTIEPDPHDIGSWLSMKATPDGKPAVAYYDRTSDALGFAIGTIGDDGAVTWDTEEVDSYPDENGLNPGDAGKYASMAIAGDGTVWIVYQDSTNGTLKYAKRDGSGAWTIGIADVGGGSSSDAGYWASVAIDSAGNPVAVHYDNGRGDLRATRWNGSAFSGTVIYEGDDYTNPEDGSTVSGDAGEYAKIAVGADGTEYIAFYDVAAGALRLATGGPSGYSVELVDDGGDVGQWPDVLVDGSDVSISYHDVTNQDLKLARGRPGAFTIETIDDGDYVGADSALYGSGDRIGILYQDAVDNDLVLSRSRDGVWSPERVTGEGVAAGYHNETIEIAGTRYVACYDYTNRTIWFSALL
ncbi:MAG: hypothetical protein ACOZNI_26795 [Myxococcota bacterium]